MRTLLIDGDLYAYVESILEEEVVSWSNKPGLFTLHSNVGPAMARFASLITKLQRELEADNVTLTRESTRHVMLSYQVSRTVQHFYAAHKRSLWASLIFISAR